MPTTLLSRSIRRLSILSLVVLALIGGAFYLRLSRSSAETPQSLVQGTFPDPAVNMPASQAKGMQTAVLAGGCFWGVEAVFEHLNGVSDVVSGYAGGSAETANYGLVSFGQTGHAESVRVTYDPAKISYGQLLKVYFAVAHDPTQVNRQGPDAGKQYRSAIFYENDEQKQVAQAYIDQLNQAGTFRKSIATQLAPLNGFYAAEADHQNFIDRNPNYPYVVIHDLPKLKQLKEQFVALYKK
ncbi:MULTISPECIES: peptide-methionine (S)-S-oxide reductase MsrA [Cyanophyceae]|uniref:Peptide methionine sulfoxide reductase MsrA n=2 Tax=Leptolyngbyaceae TaxID=1890438 RepID=A0ABV0KI18_9CYAN|nr:peptide-methionine (S)-S-oxide reductase MsrA [Phormidium sp. FACHB-592]